MVALMLASERVFHIVKLAGAGYLIYPGAVSLHAAFSSGSPPAHAVDRTRRALRPRAALRQGILNNLGNPARSRVRRTVDGVAGAVLIGLGVRVATEAR